MSHKLLLGHAPDVLRTLEAESVQCCVTSPPYFGLRNYGVDGQIGIEKTPEAYVEALVEVFREVRRVLKPDGSLWLNLGDSYAASGGCGNIVGKQGTNEGSKSRRGHRSPYEGFKAKDLIGIPWMVAFALRADGWYLRQHLPWVKRQAMPESTKDRPCSAVETFFLLTKSKTYLYNYYDVRLPCAASSVVRLQQDIGSQSGSERANDGRKTNGNMKAVAGPDKQRGHGRRHAGFNDRWDAMEESGRPQMRRAIELAREKGLTDEHLEAIKACGVSDCEKALVTTNGAGHNTQDQMRLAAEAKLALGGYYREFLFDSSKRAFRNSDLFFSSLDAPHGAIYDEDGKIIALDVGNQGSKIKHYATYPEKLIEPLILASSNEGDTVIDPFCGSSTTVVVAERFGRNGLGIDLNPDYLELARKRIANVTPGMRFEAVA